MSPLFGWLHKLQVQEDRYRALERLEEGLSEVVDDIQLDAEELERMRRRHEDIAERVADLQYRVNLVKQEESMR